LEGLTRLEVYDPKAAANGVDRRHLSGETAADNESIGIEFCFVVPSLVSYRYFNYPCAAW
jgi:hypothetical protein